MDGENSTLSRRRFIVCIDEIKQNFVFGEEFQGRYATTVTMSDGTIRTVELAPMTRDGRTVLELKDSGGCTHMGTNATTTNGNLMIQVRDLDEMLIQSRADAARSLVLPRETSLLCLRELVPVGFTRASRY